MRFKQNKVSDFKNHFESVYDKVRNQPGCRLVILYQDKKESNLFFTYSIWENESDLETYRNSDFFKEVWNETKQLFDAKPEAWSIDEVPQTNVD
jgi:quinol monooxygenase YgiN